MAEIEQYDYELPKELIAQRPLPNRADARLMLVDRKSGTIDHAHVRDLPELLTPKDTLVLNNTKVVPARLTGFRTRTGGRWNGLFLREEAHGLWEILSQTRGKLEPGETVTLCNERQHEQFRLALLTKLPGGGWIAKAESEGTTLELLDRAGQVPLPPYIRGGHMEASDRQRYQTVYADEPGAVAAPTAGLHFTDALLTQLKQSGDIDGSRHAACRQSAPFGRSRQNVWTNTRCIPSGVGWMVKPPLP